MVEVDLVVAEGEEVAKVVEVVKVLFIDTDCT
jgi:hypothetical protein